MLGGLEAGIALLSDAEGEWGWAGGGGGSGCVGLDQGWCGAPIPSSLPVRGIYWCITAPCSLLSVISLSAAAADSISHPSTNTRTHSPF